MSSSQFHQFRQFRLVVLFVAGLTLLFISQWQVQSIFAQANQCFASLGNSTEFASVDAQAVRDAAAAAPANGTVKIAGNCSGVANQSGTNQVVRFDKVLTFRGGYTNTVGGWDTPNAGSNPTTLDALGSGRVIYANKSLTVENLIVQNGYISGSHGGGIYAYDNLHLFSSQLNNNVANGADANQSGGGAIVYDSVTMSGTTVYNNRSTSGGGGVFIFGTVAITNTSFLSNTAGEGGGGLVAFNDATLVNVTFDNNHVPSGSSGGAELFERATIVDTTVIHNSASENAGGLALFGPTTLTRVTVQGNSSGNGGGGVVIYDSATVVDTTFVDNSTASSGGGLITFDPITMTGVSFIRNTSGNAGGGAYLSGPAMVTATHFLSNSARLGGGAYMDQIVRLGESSFISNTATHRGGAIFVSSSNAATMPIVNSLFVRNRAQSNNGDALYLELSNPAARIELLNNTIANPTSTVGSKEAIYVYTGTVGITNTIITSHTTAIRRINGTVFENYNILFGNTTNFNGAMISGGQSITNTNPAFANSAADDYHLSAGSVAIDSGSTVNLDRDFDGTQRPYGYGVDRGFVEYRYPLPELSINDGTVSEGGEIIFTVTLLSSSARPITVTYTTANNSALAGVDYVAQSGTLFFAAGETSKAITTTTTDENIVDSGESFFVILSQAIGANFVDNIGVGTITDSDTTELTIASASSEEGNALNFVVSLSNPSDSTITANYTTQDGILPGQAAQAGSDYTAANNTLSFAPGVMTQTITIATDNDTLVEANETLSVILSNPVGALLGTSSGVGTITDNDTTTLFIDDVTANEGASLSFVVTLTNPSALTITVDFATQDDSAVAVSDYVAQNGTLTFAPGETVNSLTILGSDDSEVESSEQFNVILSNAVGASIGDTQGVGTINDDDSPTPTPTLTPVVTDTPTQMPIPGASPTPTQTPIPGVSPTPSATPNPNATSTPVASATPITGGSGQQVYLPLVAK